jgi:hypothetical protein
LEAANAATALSGAGPRTHAIDVNNYLQVKYSELADRQQTFTPGTPERRLHDALCALLQMEISRLLRSFLNGDTLTRSSRISYPLLAFHREVANGVAELVRQADSNGIRLTDSLVILKRISGKSVIRARDYADFISSLYREFYAHIRSCAFHAEAVAVKVPLEHSRWKSEIRDQGYFEHVFRLRERIKAFEPQVKGFYIHGSLATLDYVKHWSDLDDLIVVSEATIRDPAQLQTFHTRILETLPLIFAFDPLQHHGHGFLAEQELSFFPGVLFPLPALENAVCCFGANELVFHRRQDTWERGRQILQLLLNLEKITRRTVTNPYVLKAFASSILLLPSLYLQTRDIFCYKRDSFELARRYFGTEWKAVEIATDIRREWTTNTPFHGMATTLGRLHNANYVRAYHYFADSLPAKIIRYADELIASVTALATRVVKNLETDGFLST